ncbi:MAG: S24/S26 family peptidase [Candidatus Acidiferrales bacterium]
MSPSSAFAPAPIPEFTPSGLDSFVTRKEAASNSIAEKLRADGSVCFRVLGASMFPWIRSGDLAFVRRCGFEQASRGDVILFERDSRLFAHRVLHSGVNGSRESAKLITKGDALDSADLPVSRAEFLGRVIRVHRGNRHIDMESVGHKLLGRLLARLSQASFVWYRPVRATKHFLFS